MNKVIIGGRLTNDVKPQYTKNNKLFMFLTIAVNKREKDSADFIKCIVWNKTAEYIRDYCKGKGAKILITGKLHWETEKDSQGNYKDKVFVKIESVEDMDFKERDEYKPTNVDIPDEIDSEVREKQIEEIDDLDYDSIKF